MTAPTAHQLAAAVQVARLIDAAGNAHEDARAAYRTTPTDASFAPESLRAGEGLLLAAGLLRLESGRLEPTPALSSFVAISDSDLAAQSLDRMVEERTATVDHGETGNAGEEAVLALVRSDLEALYRPDLASQCERVSLVSDWFGYDITAPKVTGATRRLEVKTMSADGAPATVRFFLSRNEYDTGRANPAEWAMVACWRSRETGQVDVLGWCRAATLNAYLPADQGGRWTEALIHMPVSVLTRGFPAAV